MGARFSDYFDGDEPALISPTRSGPLQPRGLRLWAAPITMTVLATWVAAHTVRGIELDGPAVKQLVAVSIVAHLFQLPLLLYDYVMGRVTARGQTSYQQHRLSVAESTRLWFLHPWNYLSLWLAVELCGLMDLPLRISGFWPLLIGGMTVAAIRWGIGLVLTVLLVVRSSRYEIAVSELVRVAACAGVLWLSVRVFDDARLDGGPWWQQVLILIVLAIAFRGVDLTIKLPASAIRSVLLVLAVYTVVANMLVLWLVTWFSTWLDLTLHVAGRGTFLQVALIAGVVMWLVNLPFLGIGRVMADRAGGMAHPGNAEQLWFLRRYGVSPLLIIPPDPPPIVSAGRFGYRWWGESGDEPWM